MKKTIKLMLLSLALFTTIKVTSAFFTTSTNNISIFNTKGYKVVISANGGTFNNNSIPISHNVVTLPTPTKIGYTFKGYSNTSNGNIDYLGNVNIDNISENGIYAIWNINSYTVDINPVIDGTTYSSGLAGFTFDVWIDGNLVGDDVIDWYQSVNYGSTLRVKTNSATGRNTNYDQTVIIGTNAISLNPSWGTNTYESHFYLNGSHVLTTYNVYGTTVNTPNTSASALGYNSNFYYLNGFTPWTSWIQPDYAIGFDINIAEYNCVATFGTRSTSNANAQLTKLQNAGYSICYVSGKGVVCVANYSAVQALYNNGWNILPKSGSGYSIYKSMSCDSGWGIEENR